jgi:Domain of unknown function (DUF4153)
MAPINGRGFGGGNMAADRNQRILLSVRLVTALVQALVLYLLFNAAVPPSSWPVTEPSLFVPIRLVAIFVPLVVLLGVSQLQALALIVWVLIATAAVALIGYHDATRGSIPGPVFIPTSQPWFRVGVAVAMLLFIAHTLVVDSILERRWRPSYARHFDTAWKQAIQLALAALFTAVFWGVLLLGSSLFELLKLDFLRRLITHAWFAYPATTLAVSLAIHATDVQPALIRGTRSIALTLFSWLLPLLALIVLGFLACLPFIALAPLWNTHFATSLLLTVALAQVFFINTCYQDGADGMARGRLKRIAGSVAAVELAPLTILAACALGLRVTEYGWTGERVLAAACVIVAGCYAFGYLVAVVNRAAWLRPLETVNWLAAYAVVALVLALMTPIADPARLMVTSQMNRLRSHQVSADKFDFLALKFAGARWGTAALEQLRQQTDGPDAATISRRAAEALAAKTPYMNPSAPKPPSHEQMLARIDVYPPGHPVPDTLLDDLRTLGNPGPPSGCFLPNYPQKCIARFIRLQPDAPEVLIFLNLYSSSLLEQDAGTHWKNAERLDGNIRCDGVRDGFLSDKVTLETHPLPDIVVGGQRFTLLPPVRPCGAAPVAH